MIIITIIIGLAVSGIILYATHSAYKSGGKEVNRLTFGKVLFLLVLGQIFAFGCLGNLLDPTDGDLFSIGGR